MMIVDVTKTETHETVFAGSMTGEQFRELVLEGLRRDGAVHCGHHGVSLELTIGERLMETKWPDVRFTVTKDELWMRKQADERF